MAITTNQIKLIAVSKRKLGLQPKIVTVNILCTLQKREVLLAHCQLNECTLTIQVIA